MLTARKSRISKGLWWDRAWSLVQGCEPCSPGCRNCWAAAEAHMRSQQSTPMIRARYAGITNGRRFNGTVRTNPDALQTPTPRQNRYVWSVWTDLWHEAVPLEFIVEAYDRMATCGQHLFVVCTKRAERMQADTPAVLQEIGRRHPDRRWAYQPLPNVVNMVTAENQEQWNARVWSLINTDSACRAVACEPLLEPIGPGCIEYIDWLIAGAETGPQRRRIQRQHLLALQDAAAAAGVPFFMKAIPESGRLVTDPDYIDIRREFPETGRA